MKKSISNSIYLIGVILILSFSLPHETHAQRNKVKPEITWLTFDQLADSMRANPKKIFIDIYAEWCGPCKLMDKKTFPNKYVTKVMNESYYAVKFDAEKKDTIVFNGKSYVYTLVKEDKGVSALALEIGMEAGRMSYPTLVILDENYNLIYRYPSFLSATLLEEVLIQYK